MNFRLTHLLLSLCVVGGNSWAANSILPAISATDASSVQSGIDAALKSGVKKVIIPPGTYRLTGPLQAQRAWHLQFKDLNDVEIDATGVTLLLTNPVHSGILFSNCRNVTFRGARISRDPLPFSQGTIEAVDPKGDYLDLRIDAGYPDQLDDRTIFPTFWAGLFTTDGKELTWSVRAKTPPEITRLDKGLFRILLYDKIPSIRVPITPGMRLAWRGKVMDDIRPMNCGGMKFMDITIAGAHGMAFHEMGGPGGNLYKNCRVTYPSRPAGAVNDSLFSSCADGLHSHDMEKGPIVEDCLFEGIGDDAVAIHGTYSMVAEASGKRVVAWVFNETRDKLFCRPGEKLRFYDPKGAFAGEGMVAAVKLLPGYKPGFKPNIVYRSFQELEKDGFVEILLEENAPAVLPSSTISNSNRTGSGYAVRNTIARNSFARGVLAKGTNGLIEGCTFENLFRAGVEFMSEMEVWSEADYSRDIVVRNNTFRRVSQNRGDGYLRHPGALTIFNYRATTEDLDLSKRKGHYVASPGGHQDIVVEGNRFEDINGPNILVTSARAITIRNNQFVRPMYQDKDLGTGKGIDTTALVWLSECQDVKLENNTVTDAGPFLKRNVTATATAAGTGFDSGVSTGTSKP